MEMDQVYFIKCGFVEILLCYSLRPEARLCPPEKNQMRILHLLSSTGFHGAEHLAAELIRQLRERGVSSFVGAFRSNSRSNIEILGAVSDYATGTRVFECKGRIDLRTVSCLREFLKDNGIEIVHSHKYKTNLYSLAATYGLNCRLVATCHNWLTDSLALKAYAILDKIVLRRFDAAIGVSEEVTEELQAWLPKQVVHKIANGVDVERYRPVLSRQDAKKALGIPDLQTIGFVGRLSPAKGVSVLLSALKRLHNQGIPFCALIVGEGEHRTELTQQVRAMGLHSKVQFLGERADTPLVYSALDVFVLPSFKEAFPMTILEAMASGVPVVATRVGDVNLMVEDKVTGRLVQPGDEVDLSAAIGYFLSDPDHATRIAEKARARVIDRYSSRAMAERYHAIYGAVLHRS